MSKQYCRNEANEDANDDAFSHCDSPWLFGDWRRNLRIERSCTLELQWRCGPSVDHYQENKTRMLLLTNITGISNSINKILHDTYTKQSTTVKQYNYTHVQHWSHAVMSQRRQNTWMYFCGCMGHVAGIGNALCKLATKESMTAEDRKSSSPTSLLWMKIANHIQ